LSPELEKLWGFIAPRHLVLATEGFIVWIDEELEIDWKSRPEWDAKNGDQLRVQSAILNRASALEAGEWDHSDEKRTLNLKRQIAEGIARYLSCEFVQAQQMLDKAEEYRAGILKTSRRTQAIEEQVEIKDSWKRNHKRWNWLHYGAGCAALLFSTLVAAQPAALGMTDSSRSLFAWLAAFMTALLTFLTPDKKADKFLRAWSILNSEITIYKYDESHTVNDVLEAYHRGESIIFENATTPQRTPRAGRNRLSSTGQ
jgi:hypothetical protein